MILKNFIISQKKRIILIFTEKNLKYKISNKKNSKIKKKIAL